ncbi:MAG: phenylalanine--tRNA ligase beta subunit-related protein [Bacteroidales bacterium]|nr:phenylalanine--tRNA ligase beta subunit-related protein [Bacteroidales bacterium]MDD3907863.1 phenylalanine--tRNA ligase beta subunit-related protein [Bacteroidales bacterium]MDD4712631.1 phenylalanine--tRNA ligase beta subunit-related protein [Bacteroidales bacterium]
MKQIEIDPLIRAQAPRYSGIVLVCSVVNTDSDQGLWLEMNAEIESFRQRYVVEDINKLPGIYEMRQLYKKLGKDPNRYRPSAEALCRRILKDKNLYRINTLVDVINLISIHSGFSIGGFDYDQIEGDIRLGVGMSGEKFEAIGRGLLNIEGLPVYRDEVGGIGTPTSDEERTKIDLGTKKLLMIINSAVGPEGLEKTLVLSRKLLEDYVQAKSFEIGRF